MSKADIISYITARWGDITSPKRVPLLDREVSNVLVNEMFPTEVAQNITTGSITCALKWKYTGNEARVIGRIKNNSGAIIGNGLLFALVNSTFEPKDLIEIFDTNNVKITIASGGISLIGVLGVGEEIYINESYQIND